MRRLAVRGAVLASPWVVCHSAGAGRLWTFLGVRSQVRSVYIRVFAEWACAVSVWPRSVFLFSRRGAWGLGRVSRAENWRSVS